MKVRALAAILAAMIGLLAAAPIAWAEGRAFTLADYEHYFAPGRFASHSPYYASDGLLEILTQKAIKLGGQHMLLQSARSIDIAPNYDESSEFPYYKVEAHSADKMLWDDHRKAYLYTYSNADFDSNDSIVWESRDTEIDISPGDRRGGQMHAFYSAVDRKLGRDAKRLDREYRRDVVGLWSWSCAYISDNEFEVACKAVHQPTQREEDFYYRRLDLVG